MENEVRERDFTYQHKLSYFTDVRKTGFLNLVAQLTTLNVQYFQN